MEEVEGEIQPKLEIKEEFILPLVELGVAKKEDKKLIEAVITKAEEEYHLLKLDSETKPTVLTTSVSSCSALDVKNDKGDLRRIKGKIEVENSKKECSSYVTDQCSKPDTEEIIEDILLENYEAEGKEDHMDGLQNVSKNTSSTVSSTPLVTKKKYVKERKYICKYCNKRFPQSDILLRHIRTHTGERPYECSFCSKRFISKSLLKRHSFNHTGKRYLCTLCGKRFLQSQGLKTHMLIHEGEKPFKCAQCHICFRQKSCLIRHCKRIHLRSQKSKERQLDLVCANTGDSFQSKDFVMKPVKNSDLIDNYECNDCGRSFKSKNNLLEHMQNEHYCPVFTCGDCGKTLKSKSGLTSHMKLFHFLEQNPRYCCNICGFASTSKNNCKTHEKLHENVFPFKCEYCNMSFKQRGGLHSHNISVHESEKLFRCIDCNSSFKTKQNLLAHIEVHHNDNGKQFSCDICKMNFKRQAYLKRHIQTHTDADKVFICDICGLRCRSKTDIAKHVLIHFGAVEKTHICDLCGAAFSKPSHMTRHLAVHSNKRSFKCDLCDKAYKDPSTLKLHHESIHCGASFSCKTCGFRSTNRQSFHRHLRHCHSIKNQFHPKYFSCMTLNCSIL